MRQQFRPVSHGLNMFNFLRSNVRLSHWLCKFQPITNQRNATQGMASVWTMDMSHMTLKLINIVKNYPVVASLVWQTNHKVMVRLPLHRIKNMVVMRRYGKSRRTLEGQEVKSFLSLVSSCLLARSRRRPIGLAIITRTGTFYYTRDIAHWLLHKHNWCMYSHGCCIQTVCMDGTFQRQNVISVSINVIRSTQYGHKNK